jgi:hypothetical protein
MRQQGLVQLGIENVLLAKVMMFQEMKEHALVCEEFMGLASSGVRVRDQASQFVLGGLEIAENVLVFEIEELGVASKDVTDPRFIEREDVPLFDGHVTPKLLLESLEGVHRLPELQAHHVVSMDCE